MPRLISSLPATAGTARPEPPAAAARPRTTNRAALPAHGSEAPDPRDAPGRSVVRTFLRPFLLVLVLLFAFASAAHAGTGGQDLPWNHPLQVVVDNLTGPTAKTVAALAFVLGGAMWMFTSHEQGAKRFGQALFGVAIVLGAVNIVDALGFQGAIG